MAPSTPNLIHALRSSARRLQQGAPYAWGNHGQCNCGHLLQSLTSFSAKELVHIASGNAGEWTELAEEYCNNTNLPVGQLVAQLQQVGLTPSDIHHLEYLTDKEVLKQLPGGFRWLKRNKRNDVILYFNTLADMLERKWKRNYSTVKIHANAYPTKAPATKVGDEQLYCAPH